MSKSTLHTHHCDRCDADFQTVSKHPAQCPKCRNSHFGTKATTKRRFSKAATKAPPKAKPKYAYDPKSCSPEKLTAVEIEVQRLETVEADRKARLNDGRRRIGGVIYNPLEQMFDARERWTA